MTAFAEDFCAEIAREYDALLNDRADPLGKARLQGMSALVGWVQRRVAYDLICALDTANPGDVHRACARGALALLMVRDAYVAFDMLLADAYALPEEEHKAKITAALEAHGGGIRGLELPAPTFETMLRELGGGFRTVTIAVQDIGFRVFVKEHRAEGEPRSFGGASILAAVSDAHAVIIEGKNLAVGATDPRGQS